MPRVQLVANTPKKLLTGPALAAVTDPAHGQPRRDDVGYSLKVPASGGTVEIDSVSIAVGQGYELAAGEVFGDVLGVGEDLWAVSATTQTIQLKISGALPSAVLA